jgi:outer membrane protein TolC
MRHAIRIAFLLLCGGPALAQQRGGSGAASSEATTQSSPAASGSSAPFGSGFGCTPASDADPGGAPLTLAGAFTRAREANTDLRIAQERLARTSLAVDRAWTAFKPRATVGGSGTMNDSESVANVGGQRIVIRDRFQAGFNANVQQPLFTGPAIPRLRQAYASVEQGRLGLERTRRELLYAVAETYYGALGLQRIAEVARNQVEITRQHEAVARARFEAGDAAKVAVVRAEIARLQAEQDVRTAENAFEAARGGLACLLGLQPTFALSDPPPQPAPGDPAALMKAAIEARPDLKAARVQRDVAQAELDAAWYEFLPQVAVSWNLNAATAAGFTGQLNWAATLGVTVPLYDAGARYADIRDAESQVREAALSLAAQEAKARDEVRRAALDLDTSRANLSKAEEQERLARENHALVKAQFEAGLSTQVEVADAQASLFSAEIGQVRARLDVELAAIRLGRAAGQFNP